MKQIIQSIAHVLLNAAQAFVPGQAGNIALLRAAVEAIAKLREQIERIRKEDPEAYAQVAAEFRAADKALTAALDAADERDAAG